MSSRYMMPTARLLAAAGTVHLPDMPGFGKSGKPAAALSIGELADVLERWIKAQGITAPIMIGNSLGAQVIADLAARYPGSVGGAVLLAPTIDPMARKRLVQIFRLARDIPREPVSLYWTAVRDYLKAGAPRLLRTLDSAIQHDIQTALSAIEVPVLLIRGARDPIIPASWMLAAAKLIPSARVVEIPGAAHAVNFNAPEAVTCEVLRFVAGNGPFETQTSGPPSGP